MERSLVQSQCRPQTSPSQPPVCDRARTLGAGSVDLCPTVSAYQFLSRSGGLTPGATVTSPPDGRAIPRAGHRRRLSASSASPMQSHAISLGSRAAPDRGMRGERGREFPVRSDPTTQAGGRSPPRRRRGAVQSAVVPPRSDYVVRCRAIRTRLERDRARFQSVRRKLVWQPVV
jgi:hypothetical protein